MSRRTSASRRKAACGNCRIPVSSGACRLHRIITAVSGHQFPSPAVTAAQRLTSRPHLRLGLPDLGTRLESIEDDLIDRDVRRISAQCGGCGAAVDEQVAHRNQSRVELSGKLRTVAGERDRYVLVGAALARALGVEYGINTDKLERARPKVCRPPPDLVLALIAKNSTKQQRTRATIPDLTQIQAKSLPSKCDCRATKKS